MPIYEYQCAGCGMILERWQKLSDAPLTVCSQCGGSMSKLVSSCSFQLKGSGWYQTDYSSRMQPSQMAGTSKTSEAAADAGGQANGGKKANGDQKAGDAPKSESTTASETISPGNITCRTS